VDAGVDFIVGETYSFLGEALLALEAIKRAGTPAVMTLSVPREGQMRDGATAAEACKRLEGGGADVVGLNCARGPATTLPLLREIRPVVKCHVAALPVPYRTTPAEPTFQSLTDARAPASRESAVSDGARSFHVQPLRDRRVRQGRLRPRRSVPRRLLRRRAPSHPQPRRGAGRRPPASRFSPDMSKHILFGSDKRLRQDYLEYARRNYRSARAPSG